MPSRIERLGPVPDRVEVVSHVHAGYITACGLLVLQRRGFTTSREAVLPREGSVMIRPALRPRGWLAVELRGGENATPVVRTDAEAEQIATAHASRIVGRPLSAAPFTAAYMHERRARAGQEDDRIVSPLRYEPGSDTVRICATKVCAAFFPDGSFASARCFSDRAGDAAWPYVEEALATGFHSCDLREGDDFCKRRLAWLAGALWLSAAAPLCCGVLRGDMTRAT
jgi:hypothetical protein